MLQLDFAPRTRAVRIVWLLEELGLPYRRVREIEQARGRVMKLIQGIRTGERGGAAV